MIAATLAGIAGLFAGERMNPVDGIFYDLSLALTSHRPGNAGEPVAVIALDRASLDSDELAGLPRIFMSPIWAKLINGLADSGVGAIGFDMIFEYSANRFPGVQNQYDRDFLVALRRARDRIVLGRSAHAYPADPFWGATGIDALALIELTPDSDGIQRWVTRDFHIGEREASPTMVTALLTRAKGPPMPRRLMLAPAAPLEAIPTYRLIDVLRCLDQDPTAVRAAFADKVVLVGTNLAEEDRKRTPDRFMSPPRARAGAPGRCVLDRVGASDADAGTTPGVFVYAQAVKQVLTGNLVRPVLPIGRTGAAAVAALLGALMGFLLRPTLAVLGLAVLAAALFGGALILLGFGFWFALALPTGAATLSMVLAYIVRFLVEERRRRRVQHAFSHYLAPAIVDQLAESAAGLHLGGERRDVTVMFADLSGFTALSGKLPPEVLMVVTNRYLGMIVEAVEATGGYVDKFIGDAVMGVWGAPVPNPDHAAAASRAALRAVDRVMQAKGEADARGEPGYAIKIGLNSGPAVVGNVGAPQRYNYTAVGETVNIAARLEGVPDDYGCRIVLGPATAAAVADRFVLCELDWIKVKGKEDAIAIYELVAEKSAADDAEQAYPAQYRAALESYRAGDFSAAEECWCHRVAYPHGTSTPTSPPLIMAARCAELRATPPEPWDGVFVKTTK